MTHGHSKIGASSAERWFACPGSVRLSEGVVAPESEYARIGTAAHMLAAHCLEYGKNAASCVGYRLQMTEDGLAGPFQSSQWRDDLNTPNDVIVTPDMAVAVQVYLDEVRRLLSGDAHERECDIECRFHLSNIHEDLWGTADCVIYDPDSHDLWVLDYKHGEGVPVYPENNPQLLYYAVGAAFAKSNRIVDRVHLAIIQPRTGDGDPKWWDVDAIDLLDFADQLSDAVKATEAENAPLVSGEHCRWCPAAGICPKLAELAEVAPLDQFKDGKAYDVGALADSLNRVKALKGWITAVENFALSELQRGKEIPGWKLVEKQARRSWQDSDEAVRALLGDGRTEAEIMEPAALKSPAQIEELLGKKNYAALIKDYVTSASSGLTIAPSSDKRPAVNRNIADGFEPVEG